MEPNNDFPMGSNNYDTHSKYRTSETQIESDGDWNWDQFWRDFYAQNSESRNNFNAEGTELHFQDFTFLQPIAAQQHMFGVDQLPPSIIGHIELPDYGIDMFMPSYIDPSLDSTWMDTYPNPGSNPSPSTYTSPYTPASTSSPSVTSFQTNVSSPDTPTPTPTTSSSSSSASSSSFSTPVSTSSSSSASIKIYTCPFCPSTFPQKCFLNRHINTHTKPYVCPHPSCTARRATNRDLKRHMATHDPVSAPRFFCEVEGCEFSLTGRGKEKGKGFKRRDHLKRHVEVVHGGRR
ncbi:hypothetical protein VTL71DRAFT_13411 [Oculimacula yallundae]|uniref:C2H2-type domain-containing protein n=1 Tax=Oculimacula yallundae TaxID=86028 RepID=A0ABR4CKA5_9HELO